MMLRQSYLHNGISNMLARWHLYIESVPCFWYGPNTCTHTKNCSTRIMRTLYAFLGLFLQFYRPNVNVLTTFCQHFIIRYILTHQGRVMHTWVSKLTIIGSDNGLLPGRRQDIIWTNSGILLSHTSGTNLSEILSKIQTFSFKKMHLKIPSGKRRPFCLGLNVLIIQQK